MQFKFQDISFFFFRKFVESLSERCLKPEAACKLFKNRSLHLRRRTSIIQYIGDSYALAETACQMLRSRPGFHHWARTDCAQDRSLFP